MDERNGSGKYNVWTNYESWVTSLWLDNEEPSRRYWAEQAAAWAGDELAAVRLAEQLKEEVTDAAPELSSSLYADLMYVALSGVDWLEIAERMLEDVSKPSPEEDVSCDDSPMLSTNPEGQSEAEEAESKFDDEFLFGTLIVIDSRAQAIADGVLVDVTEMAEEAGIRFPVALTQAVFERYVRIPEGVTTQDETGRLWDLLFMFSVAARKVEGQCEIVYTLQVRNSNRTGTPSLVQLKALCGPGDDGKPVITIMLPDED